MDGVQLNGKRPIQIQKERNAETGTRVMPEPSMSLSLRTCGKFDNVTPSISLDLARFRWGGCSIFADPHIVARSYGAWGRRNPIAAYTEAGTRPLIGRWRRDLFSTMKKPVACRIRYVMAQPFRHG